MTSTGLSEDSGPLPTDVSDAETRVVEALVFEGGLRNVTMIFQVGDEAPLDIKGRSGGASRKK